MTAQEIFPSEASIHRLPGRQPNAPIRVAMVIPKYGLLGGAEAFAFELGERLSSEEGVEVHILANQWRAGGGRVTFHKIPVFRFPRFLRQPTFAFFVNRAAPPGRFDLIHSHDRIWRMDLFSMHGIPHSQWVAQVRRKRMSLFDRSTAWVETRGIRNPLRPLVMPVSHLVRKHLLECYALPPDQIQVIHPGVALDRFERLNREDCRGEIRRRVGLGREDVVALFVGMNFDVKGLDLVLKGMSELLHGNGTMPPLKLLVVGKGDQEGYTRLARELGLDRRVFFAGPTREVEKFYLASDLFVMPSRFDTFGMVVLEAMAAGLPVVISSNVGARDLVRDGEEGFVVRQDRNIEAIGAALKSLLDPEDRRRMGLHARLTASRHDWRLVAARIGGIYRARAALRIGSSAPCPGVPSDRAS
ncbi:Glycosyltransferase, group 1 family protein [uncultured Desulfatiglans sp.]|nr:Glycosyltransferase, group 1 family protein [uncultured Desulfatiglans sp.]